MTYVFVVGAALLFGHAFIRLVIETQFAEHHVQNE